MSVVLSPRLYVRVWIGRCRIEDKGWTGLLVRCRRLLLLRLRLGLSLTLHLSLGRMGLNLRLSLCLHLDLGLSVDLLVINL